MCGVAGGDAFGPYVGGAVAVGIVERLDRCRGGETSTRIPYIRCVGRIDGDNGLSGAGAKGIPVDSVSCEGMAVRMAIVKLGVTIEGMWRGDTMTTVFRQSGLEFPLVLTRGAEAEVRRPQEPQPPYPYVCEEVSFPSAAAGLEMHGTLTIPEGEGPLRPWCWLRGAERRTVTKS